jgi:hypothetical protein
VKTLLEMSLEDYDLLLAKCPAGREYEILKNGLVTPYPDGNGTTRTVVVLCTPAEAGQIVRLVQRLLPKLAGQIRQYPAGD